MNPEHQRELEDMVDLVMEDEHPEFYVSPVTRWYQFEHNMRDLHSKMDDLTLCQECTDIYPCKTILLLDEYIEES